MEYVYFVISPEEAEELIFIFEYFEREGPTKELRGRCKRILKELREVAKGEYSLSGKQVILPPKDGEMLRIIREAYEIGE